MAYTADPKNNPVDRLRFLLGDTDPNNALLVDAEYQYIIDSYPHSITKQNAAAFRAAASAIAIRATKRSLGPQSEDDSNRLAYYNAKAEHFEKMGAFKGVPPSPEYASPKVFAKKMMANEA